MSKIKLIVGLGNCDKKYHNTRHNAGEWFIRALLSCVKSPLGIINKFSLINTKIIINNQDIRVFFPRTYMNNSGVAIRKISQFYKIEASEILVAHDDLNLSCGKIRIKFGGSHGGHNGLKNIDLLLGTQEYYRLRIGIGHPGERNKVVNYVLSEPLFDEKQKIKNHIESVVHRMDKIFDAVRNKRNATL